MAKAGRKKKRLQVKKREKMRLTYVPISELEEWKGNPRINDDAAVRLAKLFTEHGFINPIIATPDKIIRAGHTRLKAAKKTDLKELPVLFVPFDSEIDAKMYALSDNKSSEWAEWDSKLLTELFDQVRKIDPEKIAASGFKKSEISWGSVTGADDDAIPEPPDDAVTQKGDLYILGGHRLLCGDAGKAEDVDRLLGGVGIHLVNMDPPWNAAVLPSSGLRGGLRGGRASRHYGKEVSNSTAKGRSLMGDSVSKEKYIDFLRMWFGNASRVLRPGRSVYLWGGYNNCEVYPSVFKDSGLYFSQAVIWLKEWPTFGRRDFMGNHEWCFYGWKKGAAHHWYGPTNARDVWELPRVTDDNGKTYAEIPEGIELPTDLWRVKKVNPSSMVHLTEKPVELATRAMTYSSQEGENVLDLFGGSGSTLIGAEKLNRNAYLMELDPLYCDVIINRYEQYTGKKAERVRARAARRKVR